MRSGRREAEDRQGWGINLFSNIYLPFCVVVCVWGCLCGGDYGCGGVVWQSAPGLARCACRGYSRQQVTSVLGGCQGLSLAQSPTQV